MNSMHPNACDIYCSDIIAYPWAFKGTGDGQPGTDHIHVCLLTLGACASEGYSSLSVCLPVQTKSASTRI